MENKVTFSSKFGTLVVVAGSCVGLGNIWRFPYLAGNNGGSAFIIIYVLCSLTIAIPIMMSEFVVGRSTGRNAFGAFKELSRQKKWSLVGLFGILTSFLIYGFYSVVAGWAISFIQTAFTEGFTGKSPALIHSNFINYINTGWKPTIAALIFIVLTASIVIGGIERGIERINKILMPMLALIIIGLFVYSTTLPGFKAGMDFLLKPDFSKITLNTFLTAIGQSFFSMSLGMGCMVTYGAYIKKETSLPSLALTIGLTDLSIAILAGFAIFPGVFTFGIEPTSGPTLVFETLPLVFSMMPAGNIFGIFFFLLVFIAAITSSVSMLEPICLFIIQELKTTRVKAVLMISSLVSILAVLCAYSQVEGSPIRLFGSNLFDFLNNITDKFMLPFGALLIIVFVGWFANKELVRSEITNNGLLFNRGFKFYYVIIRYLIPIILSLFVLSLLGIVKW
ncbi:MAG: sodium-dependent transporter [Bacteroidales bacterium]|nr:sodium-dependent transporter [Bacteroidales bacterium]MDD4685512.1 sodium-dependent transporter [Bacteroidales bacterium]